MNVEFKLPPLGKDATNGDVISVLVREGDVIAANDGVIEVETDKSVLEIPCPYPGKVTKVSVTKGQVVEVGQVVLSLEVDANVLETVESQVAVRPAKSRETAPEGQAESTEGIPAQRGSREPAVPPGVLGEDAYGHVRREPMSRIRRTIAAQVLKSATTVPHATNFDDADVTELERMCKTIPPAYLGPTVKLNSLPFAIKAVALALRQHPLLNASLDEEKNEIVYKQYVHLGVEVETPRGPLTPVIRNVDRLGVVDIARELTLLAARTRAAEFTVDELCGGTFTVSNLGATGGVYGTPIINHPEVAILLLGRSRWLLGVHEGKIEGRLMLPLSLSFDRRVVTPTAAARFLADVIDYLQSPGKLLLVK
jgi:pyruvate dehydrogenase E2 component (dihydrolipoamide acetyltransferase)